MALLILKYIMGWRFKCDSYELLRKGRHVIVYAHTSIYELLIGHLVSVIYDVPLIAIAKKELRDIPIICQLMRYFDLIYIDRQKNTNTTKYISEKLNKMSDYVFIISPEGTRWLTNDLKSGFFHIAKKSHADLWMARFDFENHIFSIQGVANGDDIQTSEYETIKHIVENEPRKENPYYPERCHLVSNRKKTSLIGIQHSVLFFIPPFIIITIMIKIIAGYFGKWM
jgi:1-acyl-sn-glycerol-3-phosphate acyltransferase